MKRKATKALNEAYGEINAAGTAIPKSSLKTNAAGENKLIAWNVGGLRAVLAKKPELIKQMWTEQKPAVLGFMETKISEQDEVAVSGQIKHLIGGQVKLIFNHSTAKKGYSGTLLIVDLEKCGTPENIVKGIGAADDEGRVISAYLPKLDCIAVLCYSPNSGQTLDRLKYRINTFDPKLAKFCKDMHDKQKAPLVLLGDLNVAVDDEDIWNVDAAHIPKSAGTTEEERQSFRDHFLSQGFVDSFKKVHSGATGWFSYWSIRADNKPRNRGLRLDYALTLGIDEIKDAFILDEYAPKGDHGAVGISL